MNQDNEKLYIYIVIGFFAVAFIFVLYFIWKPSSDNIKEDINIISNEDSYEDVQLNNYLNVLNRLLIATNYDELFERIDSTWLDSNSYNKDTLYNYLIEQGIISNKVPVVKESIALSGTNGEYYYRFGIQNEKGNIRYVVINETTPNIYTISFEQNNISNMEGKTYTYVEDGITYTLKVIASLENVAQYELTLSSTREDVVTFDLSTNQCLSIELKNGTKFNPSDITSTTNNVYKMTENSQFSVKLTFNLSLEKQSEISKINFYQVSDSKGSKVVNVDLLGGEE